MEEQIILSLKEYTDLITENNNLKTLLLQYQRKIESDIYNKIYSAKIDKELLNMIQKDLDRLSQLEDIEKELNLYSLEENQRSLPNFLRLILAEEKGFYYKKDNEVYFCRWCIRVGLQIVEVKPCYAIKETTLKSCYYGDVEEVKELEDAHYWDWKTCLNFHLRDYGKTWSLTEKELEDEK